MKEYHFAAARCSTALTRVPFAIWNRTPYPPIRCIGQFRKSQLCESCLFHHRCIALQLPLRLGKRNHLDYQRVFIRDSPDRLERGLRPAEIRIQLLFLPITERVVGSAIAIEGSSDPERRGSLAPPLNLPPRWVRYEIMKSFKRGNSIFAIHINAIPAKDRQTKLPGLNPLEYLGITYSTSGVTATLHEVVNGHGKNTLRWTEARPIKLTPFPSSTEARDTTSEDGSLPTTGLQPTDTTISPSGWADLLS